MKLSDKNTVVAALRSGRYKQCTGSARVPSRRWGRGHQRFTAHDAFCALGVAADALGFEWATPQEGLVGDLGAFLADHGIGFDLRRAVVELNDVCYLSFSAIADWFEANVRVDDDPADDPVADIEHELAELVAELV